MSKTRKGPKCRAKGRTGKLCGLPAGHGTDHVGTGRCARHGGSTPSHERAARRQEALAFAAGALGAEVADDPLDALLQAVRLASGEVAYWRLLLAGVPPGERPPDDLAQGFGSAVLRLARVAESAVRAGVAERLVEITERQAQQVSLAAEEGLAAIKASTADRTLFAQTFAAGLTRRESAIEGTARELTE